MVRRWLVGLALGASAGVLLLAGSPRANADEVRTARFNVVQGSVTVRGQNGTIAATEGMHVNPGDYLSTGPNARAEIDLANGAVLRLAGSVQAHVIDGNQIQLADGTVELSVIQNGAGTTQIDTPSVTVRSTDKGAYRVSIVSGGGTQITARRGQAVVVTPSHTYAVTEGTSVIATGSASNPNVVNAAAVAYDSFDQFAADRDKVVIADAPAYGASGDPSYYGGASYGYAWPAPIVVAPVCSFGLYIGWGGVFGGCSIYPAIAYYPWYPWGYYGWGYGLGFGWGWGYPGWGWGYPYYGGYAWNGYPCCYNGGGGYHPRPYTGPGWHRDPVNTGRPVTIARDPITPIRPAAPIRDAAPVRPAAPVRIASNGGTRTTPVTHTAPATRSDAKSDPWKRFDTNRGTKVSAQAPVVARNEPVRTDPVRTDPVRTDPAHNAPVKADPSDPWSRFTQSRGDVAIRPETGDPRSLAGGNPYPSHGSYGDPGSHGYGGTYGGTRGGPYGGTFGGSNGTTYGGSRSGGSGAVSHSAPSAPSGGGSSHGGGRPH